jgi:hypothetical protein
MMIQGKQPKFLRQLVLWIAVMLVLAACGKTGDGGATKGNDDEGAVQVVKDFIAATKDGDVTTVISLIEPNEDLDPKGMSAELRTYTSMIEDMDMENETYTLEKNDGKEATVRFTTTVSFSVLGGPKVEQDTESLFTVVRSKDRWYIRDMQPVMEGMPQ